ncbi:MAG TPA: PIN domain-containing protein [Vicinamibacterales bacterium]
MDTSVLIDVLDEDEEWMDWSAAMLARAGESGPVIINPLVYAETSVAYRTIEALDAALPTAYFVREPLPWTAAFLAAKAFAAYRRRGGVRRSPLADVYIGAHAAVAGYTLLTRDAARYRTYFPKLRIVAP